MKTIYLSLGILFGTALGILPAVWDNHMDICIGLYGPINGILFALLPTLPLVVLMGTVFGWLGYRLGRSLEDAAKSRAQGIVEKGIPVSKSVWPPPPKV